MSSAAIRFYVCITFLPRLRSSSVFVRLYLYSVNIRGKQPEIAKAIVEVKLDFLEHELSSISIEWRESRHPCTVWQSRSVRIQVVRLFGATDRVRPIMEVVRSTHSLISLASPRRLNFVARASEQRLKMSFRRR